MAKYIVTTRVAMIVDADSAASAADIMHSVSYELDESYGLVFDTINETIAKELFV